MFKNRDAIGKALKQLRETHGVTGQVLATRMGTTQGLVSKIETGRIKPSVEYIEKFCRALGTSSAVKRDLTQMTSAFLLSFDRWSADAKTFADLQGAVFRKQKKAKRIEAFTLNIFPGFLQTEKYARALFQTTAHLASTPVSKKEIEAGVKARVKQKVILDDPGKALTIVVSEAVLADWPFGPMVHERQLFYILSVLKEHRIDFRVVRFAQTRSVISLGTFLLFDRKFIEVEAQTMCFNFWEPAEVDVYGRVFDEVLAASVGGEEARDIVERYWRVAQQAIILAGAVGT